MSFSGFDSDLTDLSDSEYSGNEEDVPLASTYKASSSRKSNKNHDQQVQHTLRPPRITQFSAKALYDQIVEGSVDLDPEYQRDIVWPETKQAGLIDSILHNYYVPPIIFAVHVTKDGHERRTCIDGKQRLTSIQRFMDGLIPHKDSFTNQKIWYKSQAGQAQKLLPDQRRKLFANKQIACVEYENLNPDQEREIFQRVQLGVPLTPAERMQAITGPWPSFIREIQREILGEHGFEGYLDWGRARGRDFQCLASIAYLASKYPALSHPGIPQLERWMQDPEPVQSLLHSRLLSTFRIFVTLARDQKYRGPLQHPTRVSPVEFVMIGLLIFVHSRNLSYIQLSHAIQRLRTDVRASYIDIRLNTRILKHMFAFVSHRSIRSELRSDGKGDIPAATTQMQSKVIKRKRVLSSDDDEDVIPLSKSAKRKPKPVDPPKDAAAPAKRKKHPKTEAPAEVVTKSDTAKPSKTSLTSSRPTRPVPKPVKPAVTPKTSPVTVKPPTTPSPRVPTSTLTEQSKKTGNARPNSKPTTRPPSPSITKTATPAPKVENEEPILTSPRQPVPIPPNRKLSKRSPPTISSAATSTSQPPSVSSPKIMPPAVSSASSPLHVPPTPAVVNLGATPPVSKSPPPQTEAVVKNEHPLSPPASFLNIGLDRPSNVTSRLAPLRAARAAVNGSKTDLLSTSTVGTQPQSSLALAQSTSASFMTRDPRRRPMPPAPQPEPQQPPVTDTNVAFRSNIEDLLMHGSVRDQSMELASPTIRPTPPAMELANRSLPPPNAHVNDPAKAENENNFPAATTYTNVHSPRLGEANMSISPQIQQTQTVPSTSRPLNFKPGEVQHIEADMISTGSAAVTDDQATNVQNNSASPNAGQIYFQMQTKSTAPPSTNSNPTAPKRSMSLNEAFPDRPTASLPARPPSPSSASGSISGSAHVDGVSPTDNLAVPMALRSLYPERTRDGERGPESRYAHPDGPPGSRRRDSYNAERWTHYRKDYRESERSWHRWHGDRNRDRDRGWDGGRGRDRDRDRDRTKERDRYGDQDSNRGRGNPSRSSTSAHRDLGRENERDIQ